MSESGDFRFVSSLLPSKENLIFFHSECLSRVVQFNGMLSFQPFYSTKMCTWRVFVEFALYEKKNATVFEIAPFVILYHFLFKLGISFHFQP